MLHLDELTGQKRIVAEIMETLLQGKGHARLLFGPSGSGKSWLTRQVTAEWEAKGQYAFEAVGDPVNQARSYFPFHATIAQVSHGLYRRQLAEDTIIQSGKAIPKVGYLIGLWLEKLLRRKSTFQKRGSLFLEEKEQNILFHLQSIAKQKRLLLVADNLQWWDSDSLVLLQWICSKQLQRTYPFLRTTYVLGIFTENSEVINPTVWSRTKESFDNDCWYLPNLSRAKFADGLKCLGLNTDLSSEVLNTLFSITNGHLHIAKRLAEFLSGSGSYDDIVSLSPKTETILGTVLNHRLHAIGADGGKVAKTLDAAAIIGSSFTYAELRCVTRFRTDELDNMLAKAEALSLVTRTPTRFTFAHDVLREYFAQEARNNGSSYDLAFGDCLRLLRPSDYLTRARHYDKAEEVQRAAELFFAAYAQETRRGRQLGEYDKTRMLALLQGAGLLDYFKRFESSYQNYAHQEFEDARMQLQKLEDIHPNILVAEKDYLLALCLSKSARKSDRELARDILKHWEQFKNVEAEIWARMVSTLMIVDIHLEELSEARRLEKELIKYFAESVPSDPDAWFGYNILRRKAASLHDAETAVEWTKQSAKYFGGSSNHGTARNPIQYYMALTNLSGNLLVTGNFDSAKTYSDEALQLKERYRNIEFTRPEIPLNNHIIARFYSEEIDARKALSLFDDLLRSKQIRTDRLLLSNNLAVFKALSGHLHEAANDLSSMSNLLLENEITDSFYSYFVNSNLISLRYLLGGTAARDEWQLLKQRIPSIPHDDRIFLARRHDLMSKAFGIVTLRECVKWNDFLRNTYPYELGASWKFYGKGFLLTDLQFWSDS